MDAKTKEAAPEKKYHFEPADATVAWKRFLVDCKQI
jgi:hypothetical protein